VNAVLLLKSPSSNSLSVPYSCSLTTVGKRTFPVSGANLWNELSPNITSAPSLYVFKQHLKTFPFRRSLPGPTHLTLYCCGPETALLFRVRQTQYRPTCRRPRRDATVKLTRVGVLSRRAVCRLLNSQLAHDDCRRVRSHRRRDSTRQLLRVIVVGGVYWALNRFVMTMTSKQFLCS